MAIVWLMFPIFFFNFLSFLDFYRVYYKSRPFVYYNIKPRDIGWNKLFWYDWHIYLAKL